MAEIDDLDRRIINALQGGFPLVDEPYREVAETLEVMGLDDCAIDAHALAENIDLVGEFDILITRTDARRHFALQEMRRHKEFALRMKRAISEVLEAEFREVETGALEQ